MTEKAPANAVTFIRPAEVTPAYREKGVPGTEVGVEMNGKTVWSKVVTPVFVSVRLGPPDDALDIPKPFYASRIGIAKLRANIIAKKINASA